MNHKRPETFCQSLGIWLGAEFRILQLLLFEAIKLIKTRQFKAEDLPCITQLGECKGPGVHIYLGVAWTSKLRELAPGFHLPGLNYVPVF